MRFPPHRTLPTGRVPRFAIIILLNILFFAAQQLSRLINTSLAIEDYLGLTPVEFLRGSFWQIITYQFLHAGWIHIILNLVALYFFGRAVEEQIGPRKFTFVYFGSGIFGGLLQTMVSFLNLSSTPYTCIVGASAGVFGLVATYATLNANASITLFVYFVIPVTLKAKYLLWIEFILAVLGTFGSKSNIAHAAHLGGLLVGWLYARSLTQGWSPKLSLLNRFKPRKKTLSSLVKSGKLRSVNIEKEIQDLPPDELLEKAIDPILDKIAARGIDSLSEKERKILELARERIAKKH